MKTIPGLNGTDGTPPTEHGELLAWATEVAELSQPDRVVFADGSDAEWDRLTSQLVEAGTFTKLNEEKKPNSFVGNSDPSDVARVESRMFICSRDHRSQNRHLTPVHHFRGVTEEWGR